MDRETLQQKTTHNGRENSKLQDFQGQDSSGEGVWNISEQILLQYLLLGTMVQRLKVVKDIVLTCVVSQHAENTPGQSRQGTHPSK